MPTIHDYPLIEWVKLPVNTTSGEPSGKRIRKRHIPDGCTHFDLDPNDPSGLLGGPLRLATESEMQLPACKDCIWSSDRAGFPAVGPREEVPDQSVQPDGSALRPIHADTDRVGSVTLRREQSALRAHLLKDRAHAPCLLCGRELPSALLVAAHIVPRRDLSHEQRLDFPAVAFLACSLGCDALFEHGYLTVDENGRVAPGRDATGDVFEAVAKLIGRSIEEETPEQHRAFTAHRAENLRRT